MLTDIAVDIAVDIAADSRSIVFTMEMDYVEIFFC